MNLISVNNPKAMHQEISRVIVSVKHTRHTESEHILYRISTESWLTQSEFIFISLFRYEYHNSLLMTIWTYYIMHIVMRILFLYIVCACFRMVLNNSEEMFLSYCILFLVCHKNNSADVIITWSCVRQIVSGTISIICYTCLNRDI